MKKEMKKVLLWIKSNPESILPLRIELNSKIDLRRAKNENIKKMSNVNNYIERNNYNGEENFVLEEVNSK